jgi:hypothetical protein
MIGWACGIALSMHVNLGDVNYNYFHPYCEYETRQNYIVGIYYNSVYKLSYFAGYKWHLNDNTSIDSVLVHGYEQYPIIPMVRFNYKYLFVMPTVYKNQVGAVLGVDYKF